MDLTKLTRDQLEDLVVDAMEELAAVHDSSDDDLERLYFIAIGRPVDSAYVDDDVVDDVVVDDDANVRVVYLCDTTYVGRLVEENDTKITLATDGRIDVHPKSILKQIDRF